MWRDSCKSSGMTRLLLAIAALALVHCAAVGESDEAPVTADALSGTREAGSAATTTTRVNLRSAPSTSSSVLRLLEANTRVTLVSGTPQSGFYEVAVGEDVGFVHGDYLTAVPTGEPPSTGSGDALVYFHGMSKLGFSSAMVRDVADGRDVLVPSLGDSALQGAVAGSTLSFVAAHSTTVGGYSLGRIPLFRLMMANAPGMSRVVMIDPTYDSAAGLGRNLGGPTAKAWLDGDASRTFLLVYGDSTVQLDGDDSYTTALSGHPRAELCRIAGAHDRFRQADMAYVLVASSCADLKAHLGR